MLRPPSRARTGCSPSMRARNASSRPWSEDATRAASALWRPLAAATLARADPCSTIGWIYTPGVLDAADLVINWQLAYIAGSSGYRRYMALA